MKKEVLDNELAKIEKISKGFDVGKVFLFGSCLESIETANVLNEEKAVDEGEQPFVPTLMLGWFPFSF